MCGVTDDGVTECAAEQPTAGASCAIGASVYLSAPQAVEHTPVSSCRGPCEAGALRFKVTWAGGRKTGSSSQVMALAGRAGGQGKVSRTSIQISMKSKKGRVECKGRVLIERLAAER